MPLPFPRKHKNSDVRSREYLTPAEVERLRKAVRTQGRYGARNDAMVLLMYRHGLRVTELVNLRWDQVDLQGGLLHVRRLKHGVPSTHPLTGMEIRALRALAREKGNTPYVFLSERGAPMTPVNVRRILKTAGKVAGLGEHVHAHQLRHATGYKLANDGQDTRAIALWLGHRNLMHTMRYTELSPARFKDFWHD